MPGRLYRFLSDDHDRLADLLSKAAAKPEAGSAAYIQFRQGLLRHIAMEEKVLLPFARDKNGGQPLGLAARLRMDHSALAALLAPSPTRSIIATIQQILAAHNPVEEDPGGLYDTCEKLAGAELDALLDRLQAVPEVKVAEHSDSERALASMRETVARAGYRMAGD